ncbi:hypothetical protein ACHWQZ_G008840 [Mnemiopsis leidyi]
MITNDYPRLVTTNTWSYPKPCHKPGYQGYIPTLNHTYGETFGNATEKYFLDYRSKTLNSSTYPAKKGGTPIIEFPKIYTDPRLVIGTRDRTRERWRSPPNYKMINYSSDLTNRNQDIQKMNEDLIQKQREVYRDKTGTKSRIQFFVLPSPTDCERFRKVEQYKYKNVSGDNEATTNAVRFASNGRNLTSSFADKRSDVRTRMMRDIHFERR